jgi:microcystin-dependent protein
LEDQFIGQVKLSPYNFIPDGYLTCDGSYLSVTAYGSLFSVIGATYGSDGKNNFKVPNLQGFEPLPHTRYVIAFDGILPTKPDKEVN